MVFVPSFLYLLVLMNAAMLTSGMAQLESMKVQVEQMTDEIEEMFQKAIPPQ